MSYLWLALISSALAALIDVRKGVIPNWLTYSTLGVVIVLSLADSNRALSTTLLGLVVGFFIPLVLFVLGHLGGGDLKLLAALGAAFGFPSVVSLLLWTIVFGFIVATLYILVTGRIKQLLMDMYEIIVISIFNRMGKTSAPLSGHSIPLGLGIFLAVVTLFVFPEEANLI